MGGTMGFYKTNIKKYYRVGLLKMGGSSLLM